LGPDDRSAFAGSDIEVDPVEGAHSAEAHRQARHGKSHFRQALLLTRPTRPRGTKEQKLRTVRPGSAPIDRRRWTTSGDGSALGLRARFRFGHIQHSRSGNRRDVEGNAESRTFSTDGPRGQLLGADWRFATDDGALDATVQRAPRPCPPTSIDGELILGALFVALFSSCRAAWSASQQECLTEMRLSVRA